MKNKILILIVTLLSLQIVNGQSSKVSSVMFLMDDYNLEKSVKSLLKAKELINEAAENEATIAQGKTWYYRGLVYSLLASEETTKDDGTDYLGEALNSFEKSLTLDDKKFRDQSKVYINLKALAAESFNGAIEKQTAKDYANAYNQYLLVGRITNILEKNGEKLQFDPMLAVKNSTFAAEDAGMYKEAIAGYKTMLEDGPTDVLYFSLANAYKKDNDEEMYVKTLDKGNKAFPDNANIIIAQLNHLRANGKTEEAMAKIDKAIELQPTNEVLYFVKAKSLDDAGMQDEAIKVYEEALVVNPKYTDAIYNIGAIYFLKGNPIVEKMNKLTTSAADTKIYNGLVEERKALYRKAKSYFERILEIKADDENAISTIKKIDRVLDK